MNEKEKQSHEELLRLINENPELPVIPEVNAELVCSDQYKWWMGGWGDCCIEEYTWGTEAHYFKQKNFSLLCDDYFVEVLCDCISDKDFDELSELPRKELIKAYEALPWKKAIIVYITLPE